MNHLFLGLNQFDAPEYYLKGPDMTGKRRRKRYNKKELEEFREILLEEKRKVLSEMEELGENNLKESISDHSGEVSNYLSHPGDSASISYEREFSMGLAERQNRYLQQIEDALERIEEGTYGICKVTGELIPKERLKAVPVAKYSIKGKEIKAKQKS